MRRISREFGERIKTLALEGLSSRTIGDQLEVDQKTVCNYVALYGVKNDKVRPGRSKKVSDRVKTLLVRKI